MCVSFGPHSPSTLAATRLSSPSLSGSGSSTFRMENGTIAYCPACIPVFFFYLRLYATSNADVANCTRVLCVYSVDLPTRINAREARGERNEHLQARPVEWAGTVSKKLRWRERDFVLKVDRSMSICIRHKTKHRLLRADF